MATRTYNAIGLGWATWIEDEDGSVILTSKDNSAPHAFCEDKDEAQHVFGVERGGPIDNLPSDPNTRAFTQSFPPEMLKRIKAESATYYADKFKAASETERIEEPQAAAAGGSRSRRKK